MDIGDAQILTYGVRLKRPVCLSHSSVPRSSLAVASALTLSVCSSVYEWFLRSRCTGFCLGHLCPKEERDTLHCVTEIEPEILFECLSHEQICDGKPHCLNGEDLRQRCR